MKLTRRDFLKVSGAATAGLALSGLGIDFSPVEAYAWELRTRDAKETPTICCYCAVGCGILCHTDKKTGQVIYTEGDADRPSMAVPCAHKGARFTGLTRK